jgi:type I restriction enzyme M protein
MDDMDRESEEWGGKASFFKGEYEKYTWSKVFDPRMGGFDLIALYSEAIVKMNQNPQIPQLFRDIFKNAYLPYRDPETLKSFLKEINEFKYDHSERLGDAYEYLLSIMDKQGDAGQFRTPRHIIDFIVEIVDPKKNETVLDPACGTAGFLISSYKHILKANTKDRPGDKLTPDERKRLLNNFVGYDISPDMVRLSLVNMYLHGFSAPKIVEYDTLTSEERWNDTSDVVLANPPFMTPKGGIRPHKRFSIQAKRSEVLFVDYIAEHLNPHGRAGVIVPEGIVFQSQTAYKNLRKMLVEGYLWAVVSLPAGVFNPYSGVKTCILFMDKTLAKKTDKVLFVKIENDGFDLGAQRRPIDKNDVPRSTAFMRECFNALRENRKPDETDFAWAVEKARIGENGEWSLSGERHRERIPVITKWPMVSLGEVCAINPDSVDPVMIYGEHDFVYVDISSVENGTGKIHYSNRIKGVDAPSRAKRITLNGDVLLSTVRPNLRAFALVDGAPHNTVVSTGFAVLRASSEKLIGKYLLLLVQSDFAVEQMESLMGRGSYPSINQSDVAELTIPLPPLDIQKAIVAEIDGYQKIIDDARQVVENYKPAIKIDPGWEMVEVGELSKPEYGFTENAKEQGDARFIRITDISEKGTLHVEDPKFIRLTTETKKYLLSKGDILVARTGATFGKTMLFDEDYPAVYASYLIRLRFPKDRVHPRYYWVFAQSDLYWTQANSLMTGGGQPQFNGNALKQVKFPLPPLTTQQQIVAEIEAEREAINANMKLISIFEQKIKNRISEIWGDTHR